MNETIVVRGLMKQLDRLIADVVKVRQNCVPLLSAQAAEGVFRSKSELLDQRARLFADDPHCQASLCFSECTIDHLRPKVRGGDDSDGNLALCCHDCNQLKGSLTEPEFRDAVDSGQFTLPEAA